MTNRELSIQKAIKALHDGIFQSERQAAEYYSVPRSTLRDRLSGKAQARASAHASRQRLSPDQEEFLTNWVIEQALFGYPPTHTRVREMASRMLMVQGDVAPLGKLWVRNFVRRNPRVAGAIGKAGGRRASVASVASAGIVCLPGSQSSLSTGSITSSVGSLPYGAGSVPVSPVVPESPMTWAEQSPVAPADFAHLTDFGVQPAFALPAVHPLDALEPRAFYDADVLADLWK